MLRRSLVFLCIAVLAASGASLLTAQPSADEAMKLKQRNDKVDVSGPLTRALPAPKATEYAGEGRAARDKNTPVHIIYDDGIVTAAPIISSYMYGNQFNTFKGAVVKSFSVTRLSFYMISGAGSDAAFISLYGPVAGTTAPFIEDILVSPIVSGAFNTFTIGPYAGGGSFLAGVWYVADDTVGLGSGTVQGQGHHGIAINDIAGTDFQTIGSLNALVGASTAFIPVELMDFTVSDI